MILSRTPPQPDANRVVYIPKPTWANHKNIIAQSGLGIAEYRYFDKKTIGFDLNGMVEDLKVS